MVTEVPQVYIFVFRCQENYSTEWSEAEFNYKNCQCPSLRYSMGIYMKITRKFIFSAAHHLTDYYGKCENPHGHTYELQVTVGGPIQKNGMVVDFALLKQVVEDEILVHLDHQDLNDFFKNPTAELITKFIWKKLKPIGRLLNQKIKDPKFRKYSRVRLEEIKLFEGPNSCVSYEGK